MSPDTPSNVQHVTTLLLARGDGDDHADILWYGPGDVDDVLWHGAGSMAGDVDVEEQTINGYYKPIAADFDVDGITDEHWYQPGGGTAHPSTDLSGYVVVVSDARLRLRTDPGPGRGEPEEIDVAAQDIEAAKPIPPRPLRRSGPPR